jgi:hypothetical protein
VPLDEIKRIVTIREFDVLAELESHRSALPSEVKRIQL